MILDDDMDEDDEGSGSPVKALLEELFARYQMRMVVYSEKPDHFGDLVHWAHPHGNDLRNAEHSHGDVVARLCIELEERGWRAAWVNERNALVVKSREPSPPSAEWAAVREKLAFERKKQHALALMDTEGKDAALAIFTPEERKRLPF